MTLYGLYSLKYCMDKQRNRHTGNNWDTGERDYPEGKWYKQKAYKDLALTVNFIIYLEHWVEP